MTQAICNQVMHKMILAQFQVRWLKDKDIIFLIVQKVNNKKDKRVKKYQEGERNSKNYYNLQMNSHKKIQYTKLVLIKVVQPQWMPEAREILEVDNKILQIKDLQQK